jgi:hypothetical protein
MKMTLYCPKCLESCEINGILLVCGIEREIYFCSDCSLYFYRIGDEIVEFGTVKKTSQLTFGKKGSFKNTWMYSYSTIPSNVSPMVVPFDFKIEDVSLTCSRFISDSTLYRIKIYKNEVLIYSFDITDAKKKVINDLDLSGYSEDEISVYIKRISGNEKMSTPILLLYLREVSNGI